MIIETHLVGNGPAASATLFFTGWGMDAAPFRSHFPAGRDCIVCHDYTHLDFDPECARGYDEVHVVAWSMGVWAASCVLPQSGLRHGTAVAVNGTMRPVDDRIGIPRAAFAGTLAGLTPASLAKFHRRMCATAKAHAAFRSAAPKRDFESVRRELAVLAATAAADGAPPVMRWDCAVVGSEDRIFPPDNQLRAWEGVRTITVPEGHYLSSWEHILRGGMTT